MVAAHTLLNITGEQFDPMHHEIEATLRFLGVPAADTGVFMDVLEHYRPEVVRQEKVEQAGTLTPAPGFDRAVCSSPQCPQIGARRRGRGEDARDPAHGAECGEQDAGSVEGVPPPGHVRGAIVKTCG